MKKWTLAVLGLLASSVCAPCLCAQVPDIAAPPVPGVPVTPVAPARNLFSFFSLTPDQHARCKDQICNSPLGEMLKSAAGPMSMMSGGLLFAKCGVPTKDDLDKMKALGTDEGAEGAAAKIKKSEAEAKARRAAIRYLGTVDCNYWPEAKAALINGLRSDPNECVRYEAALALQRGCCCNEEVMKALKDSASAADDKKNPVECSARVRAAAADALAHCTSIYVKVEPTTTDGGEKKQDKENVSPTMTHGKGIVGIIAAASAPSGSRPQPVLPPSALAQAKLAAPPTSAAREQVAAASTPQWNVAQRQEKKGLFQRIDWTGNNGNPVVKDTRQPELFAPTPVNTPVAPVNYRPLPQAPVSNPTPVNSPTTGVALPPMPETPVVPTRGMVIFDSNGMR
jgi:hypothetical protein